MDEKEVKIGYGSPLEVTDLPSPPKRLLGKVAIVTGAGRGIGRAIALAFAKEGADVVIVDVDLSSAEKVAGEVKSLGPNALALKVDVANKNKVDQMIKTVVNNFGKIDILVNNAGISMVRPSIELSEEDWNRCLAINLTGVFLCCQAAGKVMIKQGEGRIINISSIAGLGALPQRLAYCVSKAGVIMLTKVLSIEWAQYNVNVNAIAPGHTKTEMIRDLIRRGLLDEEKIKQRTPRGRLAEPEEIADAAVFLASDESKHITGCVLPVDGGFSAVGWLCK